MIQKKHVLIVGGGFGGIKTALELSKCPDLFTITLISDRPDFRYYPTLYHTATGKASRQSSLPLSQLFKNKQVELVIAEVSEVDRKKKRVRTKENGQFNYDVIVLALGSVTNYYGIPGMEKHAFSIKSVEEAKRFKAHLHVQCSEGKLDDSYIIVGGGATGIELAGVLPHYLQCVAEGHGVDPTGTKVELIEMAPHLLPRLPKKVGDKIAKRLTKLGVTLRLGEKVEGVEANHLMVDGEDLKTKTIVWTSGVANPPFFANNKFKLTDHHKVQVNEYLQTEKDTYVIGDNADTMYSGMAQTALYDAKYVASNLVAEAHGHAMRPYVPKPPITVIPVGLGWAAVLWGSITVYGLAGWFLRIAADLDGFSSFGSWWQAGEQVLTEFVPEEECTTCTKG